MLFFALRTGPPDPPTKATAPEKIQAIVLKSGMPTMWEVAAPDANANELYKKAFNFFLQNHGEFVSGRGEIRKDFDAATADQLLDMLVEASKAGKVTTPFLDDEIPITPKAEPRFKDALEVVHTVLHAGGKFGGGGYKVSGGLHGVGVSVVNALSSWMRVESARDGAIWAQEYVRGKPTGPVVYKGVLVEDV